jgi:Flp pilus assembly protein TadG
MNSVIRFLQTKARRDFFSDERGTIAVITGLMMVLMCVCIGAGIDMGRTTSAAQRLGAALDVAALHVASEVGKTDAQLKDLAEPVMLKNYGGNTYDVVSGFSLVTEGRVLKVSAKVTVKTWLMSLAGIPTMEALQKTEAIMGSGGNSIEVALVLDNTGSMAEDAGGGQTKMDALQDAATDFVNTIVADVQTPYYSRIAIVPYAANVNPGSALMSSTRMAQVMPTTCQTWGCGTYKYDYVSGGRNRSVSYTLKPCAVERQGSNAASDVPFSSSLAMYNYNANCTPSTVTPLTSVRADLNNVIAGMTPAGGTAGHIGIQWGWQTLSPTGALGGFTPSAYNAAKVKKIMVIMTDGLFNTWHCNGISNGATGGCSNANGDSFTQAKAACNAMKVSTKNIELYFVGVGLPSGDTDVDALTAACSSKSGNIILASDGAALKAAFQKIAAELQSMRLSF